MTSEPRSTESKKKRNLRSKFLKFGLRSLFAFVLLVAGFLAYIVPKIEQAKREEGAILWLAANCLRNPQLGQMSPYTLAYDHELDKNGFIKSDRSEKLLSFFSSSSKPRAAQGPFILRRLFGEHIFSRIGSAHFSGVDSEFSDEFFANLKSFEDLQVLEFSMLPSAENLDRVAQFPSLRRLSIGHATKLSDISALPKLKKLENLRLNAALVTSVGSIGELSNLKHLTIERCPKLEDATKLSNLKQLESLTLLYNESLKDCSFLKHLEQLKALRIEVSANRGFDMAWVANCKHLEVLQLNNFQNVWHAEEIKHLVELKKLVITGTHAREIKAIHTLPSGKGEPGLTTLNGMEALTKLKQLFLAENFSLRDISAIKNLKELDTLSLENCIELNDLSPISELSNLKSLKIGGSYEIEDLNPLERLTSLSELKLINLDALTDLSFAENLDLRSLWIERCNIESLKPLEQMNRLQRIDLKDCRKLKTLDGIGNQPNLTLVAIEECKRIESVNSLKALSNSKRASRVHIQLVYCERISTKSVEALKNELPSSTVHHR